MGLSETVAQDLIRAVGNYGEIYDRHLDPSGHQSAQGRQPQRPLVRRSLHRLSQGRPGLFGSRCDNALPRWLSQTNLLRLGAVWRYWSVARRLAGTRLAGFFAIPSRRISILCGTMAYEIRF